VNALSGFFRGGIPGFLQRRQEIFDVQQRAQALRFRGVAMQQHERLSPRAAQQLAGVAAREAQGQLTVQDRVGRFIESLKVRIPEALQRGVREVKEFGAETGFRGRVAGGFALTALTRFLEVLPHTPRERFGEVGAAEKGSAEAARILDEIWRSERESRIPEKQLEQLKKIQEGVDALRRLPGALISLAPGL
jgi:hypothetical protein